MMSKNKLKTFIFCTILLCTTFYCKAVDAQAATTTNLNKANTTANNKLENLPIDREKEILEKTINILDKTNASLTQRWTPITILLSITAGLFTLITLFWAGLFAWGYIIIKKIASNKKKIVAEMKKNKAESMRILEEMNTNGEKIKADYKENSKTLPELEKELSDFKLKAKIAMEKLEDRTMGTITGYNGMNMDDYAFGSQIGGNYLSGGLNNLKVCSKCGCIFKEGAGLIGLVEPIEDYDNPLNQYQTVTCVNDVSFFTKTHKVLCKKCREDEPKE